MEKLNIIWTTDNKETALNMILMYAPNSLIHAWWDQVNILIWGASANLVANDTEIQEKLKEIQDHGVTLEACKGCADNLGVSDKLIELGVNVRYTGVALTEYLKSADKLITI